MASSALPMSIRANTITPQHTSHSLDALLTLFHPRSFGHLWHFGSFAPNSVEMRLFTSLFLTGLLSLQPARAAPSSLLQPIELRQDVGCNTAADRACWSDGFDITTDYETKTPLTGVVRPYTLTLTEETNWKGPDGVVKDLVMLVNGKHLYDDTWPNCVN